MLTVSGLTPNTEYVFAVAAFGPQGELLGKSIGRSTKPILSAYPLSLPLAWGYLCQSTYKAGLYTLGTRVANIIWKQFVHPLTTEDNIHILPVYRY